MRERQRAKNKGDRGRQRQIEIGKRDIETARQRSIKRQNEMGETDRCEQKV